MMEQSMSDTQNHIALENTVRSAYTSTGDARWNEILGSLIHHLHAFAREVKLTEEEWLTGIRFLTATGQKCTDKRQEVILLSDSLGLSTLVNDMNRSASPNATESAVLGPFYVPQSPTIANGDSIALAGDGDPTLVRGRVLDTQGNPIAHAILDFWQVSPNKMYAVQDPEQPQMNLRGVLRADGEGRYSFRTFRPVSYPIPTDGPVGTVFAAAGRHPMRPAHIHFIVSADGHQPLTTQLFSAGDPYLDSDSVFGTKPSLIVNYQPANDVSGLKWTLDHDFVLDRSA
jgi:protocatechuate 3,4-dioxygenase beta subunit